MAVRIHETEPIDVQGGAVVVAFPSFGLVSTLAANYLVEALGLREVGSMEGDQFPTLAVVEHGEPMAPVRVYHGRLDNEQATPLALILAEFQPDPPIVRDVADCILHWARDKGADVVVSPEGLLVDEDLRQDNVVEVYAAASHAALRERLQALGAPLFRNGLVAGVTGTLLTTGKRDDVPVAGILAEASPDQPDARSAAVVVDMVGQLFGVKLDTSLLYDEADKYEEKVAEAMRVQRMRERDKGHTHSVMYG